MIVNETIFWQLKVFMALSCSWSPEFAVYSSRTRIVQSQSVVIRFKNLLHLSDLDSDHDHELGHEFRTIDCIHVWYLSRMS